jgi:hypothetical protein
VNYSRANRKADYAETREANRKLVRNVRLALWACVLIFTAAPLLIGLIGFQERVPARLLLGISGFNALWGGALLLLVELGRFSHHRLQLGETRIDPADPMVEPVVELWATLVAGYLTRANTLTIYVSTSARRGAAASVDQSGAPVLILSEGFLSLWWSRKCRERGCARAMLAHEAGHVVNDDLRLWTGFRRSFALARVAYAVTIGELALAAVTNIYQASTASKWDQWLAAGAFWSIGFSVMSLRWATLVHRKALQTSEGMADEFAKLSPYGRRYLHVAVDTCLSTPSGRQHLGPVERVALLDESKILQMPQVPIPWATVAGVFLVGVVAGFAAGKYSHQHLFRQITERSELRLLPNDSFVWCQVVNGACVRAWSLDTKAFVDPANTDGIVLSSLQRRALERVRLSLFTDLSDLLWMTNASRLERYAPPLHQELFALFVAIVSGYVIGEELGDASDLDLERGWAARVLAEPDTWSRWQAELFASEQALLSGERSNLFPFLPGPIAPWNELPVPVGRALTKRPIMGCRPIQSNWSALGANSKKDDSWWLHLAATRAFVLDGDASFVSDPCDEKPTQEFTIEQLHSLAILDDRIITWRLLKLADKQAWCSRTTTQILSSLAPQKRLRLQHDLFAYWGVSVECAK